MNIKQKLLLAFVTVAIIPILIFGALLFNTSRGILEDQVLQEAALSVDFKAGHVEFQRDRYIGQVLLTRDAPPVQGIVRARETGIDPIGGATLQEWREQFESIGSDLIEFDENIVRIRYLDEFGQELVAVDLEQGEIVVKSEEELAAAECPQCFQNVLSQQLGTVIVSPFRLSTTDGIVRDPHIPVNVYGTPVVDESTGEKKGTIMFEIGLDSMMEFMRPTSLGHTLLLDQDGFFIEHPDPELRYGSATGGESYFVDHQEFEALLQENEHLIEFDENERRFRIWQKAYYSSITDDQYWVVVTSITNDELLSEILVLLNQTVLTGFVVILIVLVTAFVIARSISNPLVILTRTADKIAKGEKGTLIPISGKDEIARLSESLNVMTRRLVDVNEKLEASVREKTLELRNKVKDLEESKEQIIDLLEEANESEKELRSSLNDNQKFSSAIANASDAIMLWDYGRENLVRYVNPAWERLYGYRANEVIDKKEPPFYEHILHDEAIRNRFQAAVMRQRPFTEETTLKKKDGSSVPVEIAVAPVRNQDQQIFLWVNIVRDVTERRVQERKIRELNELRDRFIRIVSHQLRTPLNAIRWNLETMLNEEMGKLTPEQKEFLRVTYEADVEVIDRIHDLLTALDIEEGRIALQKERVSLESLVSGVVSNIKKQAAPRDIAVVYEPPTSTLSPVFVDQEKIRDVLQKLGDNAITYTEAGGRVEIVLRHLAHALRVEFKDSGVGIPKAEQGQVFNRFARASNAATMKTDSSGLGLYIAKHYVESHGGKINFTSKEDEGSTFWVELPVDEA